MFEVTWSFIDFTSELDNTDIIISLMMKCDTKYTVTYRYDRA